MGSFFIWLLNFAGEPCETYHCVLESKSFLEKMTVLEHTVPFFLPLREAENDLLSSNAMVWLVVWSIIVCYKLLTTKLCSTQNLDNLFQKFIDHVGDLLQAYVDRREQVRWYHNVFWTAGRFPCIIVTPAWQNS